MLPGLAGKTLLCAGSATGIGAETARRLASEGARIVIGDVNLPGAQAVIDQIVAVGGEGLAVEFDISEPDSVRDLVARTVEHFGGLDGMHINATNNKRTDEDLDVIRTELEVFDLMHAIVLRGHLLCTRFGLPEMLKRGGGPIVYTSSDGGKSAAEIRMSYYVAKAGLNALMRHVALRYAREGIRANAVCPGLVITDALVRGTTEEERAHMASKIPSGRAGSPKDIAGMVAFLMSDDAQHVNGQAISVNGAALMAVG
jgi:NAD(P)-dependent dehydrogenase (short-subunit alcohol dehydrogenase family)